MEKIKIVSNTKGRVGVKLADTHFSRQWRGKGATINVDKETLEELMYDRGFNYLITSGMLYIEDMEIKKELGIEPEDAITPVNVIILTDKERRQYMTTMSLVTFKDKIQKINYEQVLALADFAIDNRLADMDKTTVIKKICGKDIIKSIQMNDADKED